MLGRATMTSSDDAWMKSGGSDALAFLRQLAFTVAVALPAANVRSPESAPPMLSGAETLSAWTNGTGVLAAWSAQTA